MDFFLHFSNILCINRSPGLQEVELLHVVVPQHGGGQLGVEVGVVPGAPHYLVLGVNGVHIDFLDLLTERFHQERVQVK